MARPWKIGSNRITAAPTTTAIAAEPVFDVHVHLRDGETSLREYRDNVHAAGLELSGIGAMWFGGPHQARQGELARIRAGNDKVIALAAAHPDVLPIATVHPYDGDAALAELARVAAAGAFSVMHVFVPPHPGAVAAAEPKKTAVSMPVTKALINCWPLTGCVPERL